MNKLPSLLIQRLELRNFRCFEKQIIDLNYPIVVIIGNNGVGKTSILEAIHYGCFLRSFKNYFTRDLISFNKNNFFLKIDVQEYQDDKELLNTLSIGFSPAKRIIKVNQQSISSHKELINHLRVVSITEEDLELIKGSPQIRRSFLDQAFVLSDTSYVTTLKEVKQIVQKRQNFLSQHLPDQDLYMVLTQQLWERSLSLQTKRIDFLNRLQQEINKLTIQYFPDLNISLSYMPRMELYDSFVTFKERYSYLYLKEKKLQRTLFGAHLDDFSIHLQQKKSRTFSSRGQQKLIVLLIKIAHIYMLTSHSFPAVFLLDDFMSDFDVHCLEKLFLILTQLECQLIFTSPVQNDNLKNIFNKEKAFYIYL